MSLSTNSSITVDLNANCRICVYMHYKSNKPEENGKPTVFFETRENENAGWVTRSMTINAVEELAENLDVVLRLYLASPKGYNIYA